MNNFAWITGAGGFLGHYLLQSAAQYAPAWRIHGLLRSELDLLDSDAVRQAFDAERPHLVVHCAGLTRNPDCQADPSLAHRLNVELTERLAELAAGIPFVFLSTDLVFDGQAGNYDESSAVNPLSIYGETKVKAEQIVSRHPRHLIIRTSLNAGRSPTGDRAFSEQMRRAWQRGKTFQLFVDEFRCPIPAAATARALWELINQQCSGIFHLAGAERLSRWQIGQLLVTRAPEFASKIQPASAKDYFVTPRPADTSLNCSKAQALLSFPLPTFSDWLAANPGEPIW